MNPSIAPMPPRRAAAVQAAAVGGPGPIPARLVYGPCHGAQVQARAQLDGRPPAGIDVTWTEMVPLELPAGTLAAALADETVSPLPCIDIPVPPVDSYVLARDDQGNPVSYRTAWLYVWIRHRGPVVIPPEGL